MDNLADALYSRAVGGDRNDDMLINAVEEFYAVREQARRLTAENARLREALTEAHHAVRVYASHISHLTRDDLKRAGAVSAALNERGQGG